MVNTKEKTDDKENFESAEMWIEVDGTVKERVKIRLFYSIAKLGCVVRMVVGSLLPHAESGPNDHRKDAPQFI